MNSIELDTALTHVSTFCGVWSCDSIEYFRFPPKRRASIIVNISPRGDAGIHWVVFGWNGEKLYYFDTSGIIPLWHPDFNRFILKHCSYKECSYSSHRIQSEYSDLCGQYCALFVSLFDRGLTLTQFLSCFSTDPIVNDNLIRQLWWS